MKTIRILIITTMLFLCKNANAQYVFGVHATSVSVINTQYGLPFVRLVPLHPGVEVGANFLQKSKPFHNQKVAVHLGIWMHNLIGNIAFLKTTYTFQYKIQELFGLNAYAGIGYAHAFYPGDGYLYNPKTATYEKRRINQPFFMTNIGFCIDYIKPEKIHPFVKYETVLLGFEPENLLTNFHIGLNVQIAN